MSTQSNFREHTRERIDRAIGDSFAKLESQPFARLAFANLLHHARGLSSLLRPTGDGSQQLLALEALRNIALHHDHYVAWPSTWAGGETSVYALIHSLASHVFGRYPVPRGFGLVWFGGDSQTERATRRWFIEHAAGRRFRDIANLPMKLTRKMERILLHSPHHLPLRAAMRRAEILGLRGDPELVESILATPLASDLEHGDFWRSVMHFFINHWQELGAEQVKGIVEFLYAIRIKPVEVMTAAGRVVRQPLEPNFSMVGRTPASLLRQVAEWRAPHARTPLRLQWPSSGFPEMSYWDELGEWRMLELLDIAALRVEGGAMRNCVASYWDNCAHGRSSIWSLRRRVEDGRYASRCTVEVHKRTGLVVQIRGYRNRRIRGRRRLILERWAALAGLTIVDYAW
jgi:hypothetical protein